MENGHLRMSWKVQYIIQNISGEHAAVALTTERFAFGCVEFSGSCFVKTRIDKLYLSLLINIDRYNLSVRVNNYGADSSVFCPLPSSYILIIHVTQWLHMYSIGSSQ